MRVKADDLVLFDHVFGLSTVMVCPAVPACGLVTPMVRTRQRLLNEGQRDQPTCHPMNALRLAHPLTLQSTGEDYVPLECFGVLLLDHLPSVSSPPWPHRQAVLPAICLKYVSRGCKPAWSHATPSVRLRGGVDGTVLVTCRAPVRSTRRSSWMAVLNPERGPTLTRSDGAPECRSG